MDIQKLIAEKENDYKKKYETLATTPLLTLYMYPEGKAEYMYFTGVNDYKEELNISSILKIVSISKIEEPENYAPKLVKKIIEKMEKGFYEDDIYCVVFDRDIFEKEAKKDTFSEVLSICEQYNIRILLTNPNFEFWLLLHLNKEVIEQFNPKDILENRKKGSKRFSEKKLSIKLGGYNKYNLQFERFKDRVDIAVENEKDYEQDYRKMDLKLGSNIGKFLEEIMT